MQTGLDVLGDMYLSGAPIDAIQKHFGRSIWWIYARLLEAGIKPNRDKGHPKHYHEVDLDPNTERVREMRKNGMRIDDIVKEIGRSHLYVSRRIQVKYVPPESKGFRPSTPLNDEEKQRVAQLYNANEPINRIAKTLQRKKLIIRTFLAESGLLGRRAPPPVVPWPKVTTNPKRALKGRKFEDVPVKNSPDCVAIKNAAYFRCAVLG